MITSEIFGYLEDGSSVRAYTIASSDGTYVRIMDYGATVLNIFVPDKAGKLTDVTLGYDTLEGYVQGNCFHGGTIGRYANRIMNGRFSLNGKTYDLGINNGPNHNHGPWHQKMYMTQILSENSLKMSAVSTPEEEGYPGTVSYSAAYTWTEEHELQVVYEAQTDADTVINMTNHTYFNLNGLDVSTVLDHEMTIYSDLYSETTKDTVPTGKLLDVAGTPMDFREPALIGQGFRMDEKGDPVPADYEQLRLVAGYDHNYVIRGNTGDLRPAARAFSPRTGITLEVETTQPAIQFYSANYIHEDTAKAGKNGLRYPRCGAFCVEPQHYPCSPNFPEFPSAVLKKGETYLVRNTYRFS